MDARWPFSPLASEDFAELAVDLGGTLGGFGHHFDPFLSVGRDFELA